MHCGRSVYDGSSSGQNGKEMTETAFAAEQMVEPYPPGIESHFWTLARNRIVLREIRVAEAKLGKLSGVLEIGCDRGVVLKYLRDQGIDCHGVDPSPIALPGDLASNVRSGVNCFQIPAPERARLRRIAAARRV